MPGLKIPGPMYGFAANKKLPGHYARTFHGEVAAILHPYQFSIGKQVAREIMECTVINGKMMRYKDIKKAPQKCLDQSC